MEQQRCGGQQSNIPIRRKSVVRHGTGRTLAQLNGVFVSAR
jgi:hypothetical protein